jgi:hypothetical protein
LHCVPENSLATKKNMKIRKGGKVARCEYKIFKGRKRHSTLEVSRDCRRRSESWHSIFPWVGVSALIRCKSVNIMFLFTAHNPSNPLTIAHRTVILYILIQLSYTRKFIPKWIAQLDLMLLRVSAANCYHP